MHYKPESAEFRPWYREPWPWVLIAIPLLTIIASAVTFWLAVSRPDFLVIDEPQYQQVKAQLRAVPTPDTTSAADETDGGR